MIDSKIMWGFSDIHICKENGIPIPILGGLGIVINISQQHQYLNVKGSRNIRIDGDLESEGTLKVYGLTEDEQELILGYIKSPKGGIALKCNNKSPNLRLLFSRKKDNGYKILYCVYNCIFNPSSIRANTYVTENGEVADTIEIDFDVLKDKNSDLIYYAIDTKTGNKNTVDNWFNEIQYP